MFDFKNYDMKIMSKSPSRHLVWLKGNMKPTEKIYILVFVSFYHIFQYFNVLRSYQLISVADLG